MFWTRTERKGSIWRSWMDGTNHTQIATGLSGPAGITIDFQDSRLYWVVYYDQRVQSSDMQGQDVQTVVQLPSYSYPTGIGVLGGRIYWTTSNTGKLGSSTKAGQDIQLLHNYTNSLYQMTVVPRLDLPTNRTNHCENRSCSNICVLTPTSCSCLS